MKHFRIAYSGPTFIYMGFPPKPIRRAVFTLCLALKLISNKITRTALVSPFIISLHFFFKVRLFTVQ